MAVLCQFLASAKTATGLMLMILLRVEMKLGNILGIQTKTGRRGLRRGSFRAL